MSDPRPVLSPDVRDPLGARVDGVGKAGRCNTPPGCTDATPFEAGIDTAKVVGRLVDDRSLRALQQPGLTSRPGKGGALLIEARPPDAWRGDPDERPDCPAWPAPACTVLFYPASSLLAVEGHPSRDRGVLASANDVAGWAADLREVFADAGILWPADLGLARLDAAVTAECDRSHGAALLSGVAAVQPPRGKLEVFRGREGVETVYQVTERGRKLARAYDSGHAYGTAERFAKVRLEDQRRADRPGRRLDPRAVNTETTRQAFSERWAPWVNATKGVTVASVSVLTDKLGVMVEAGAIEYGEAERLLGYINLTRSGLGPNRNLDWRRRRSLGDVGLVVAEGDLRPVEVALGEMVERFVDEAVWA